MLKVVQALLDPETRIIRVNFFLRCSVVEKVNVLNPKNIFKFVNRKKPALIYMNFIRVATGRSWIDGKSFFLGIFKILCDLQTREYCSNEISFRIPHIII